MAEDSFHIGVKAFVCNDDGQILLLRLRRNNRWDIPGGRVQRGESLDECLRREIYEETQIKELGDFRKLPIQHSSIRIPVGKSDVGLLYAPHLCHVAAVDVALSEEHTEFEWVSPSIAAQRLQGICLEISAQALEEYIALEAKAQTAGK